MELQPPTIEAIIHRLREQATKRMTTVILEARIAVTPQEFTLLDVQAVRPLETIHF
jgi:hypothetical protein